jgi:hypothetical protein
MAGSAWPSRSATTCTGTPAVRSMVACTCRRSWRRAGGNGFTGRGSSCRGVFGRHVRRGSGCVFRLPLSPVSQDLSGATRGAKIVRSVGRSILAPLASPDRATRGLNGRREDTMGELCASSSGRRPARVPMRTTTSGRRLPALARLERAAPLHNGHRSRAWLLLYRGSGLGQRFHYLR